MTGAVPEEEPIEHPFGRRILLVDEEVEDALLDRKPAAESIAADPTLRRSLAPRISHEPIEVVDLDGEVEHQAGAALAALPGPTLVVVLCERDVTFHLLGEAHALARVHLTPLLFVPRCVLLLVVVSTSSPARRFGGTPVFFEESFGEAVRQRRDGQAGVRADRSRHDGPIGDVESRIIEYLAVLVHNALSLVPPHRAAAQRVHGDDPTEVPDRIILEVGP